MQCITKVSSGLISDYACSLARHTRVGAYHGTLSEMFGGHEPSRFLRMIIGGIKIDELIKDLWPKSRVGPVAASQQQRSCFVKQGFEFSVSVRSFSCSVSGVLVLVWDLRHIERLLASK